MKTSLLVLAPIVVAVAACSVQSAPQITKSSPAPGITNYEAAGNLESTHHLGCISPNQVRNAYTPADLYPALVRCVKNNRYADAAFLFGLAGVYTRFDEQRVADATSHDVISVYMYRFRSTFSDAEKRRLFKSIRALTDGPGRLKAYCASIRKIGPPHYYPRYMVRHGMQAFTGEKSPAGLVRGFDREKAWNKSLDAYLHCPAVR